MRVVYLYCHYYDCPPMSVFWQVLITTIHDERCLALGIDIVAPAICRPLPGTDIVAPAVCSILFCG